MKLPRVCVSVLCFLISSISCLATTWDEPWHEKVVKEADYFVLAIVLTSDEHQGATLEVLKMLGGKKLKKMKRQ